MEYCFDFDSDNDFILTVADNKDGCESYGTRRKDLSAHGGSD